ncbi:peptidyl-prolyl cis-trans isomerase, FKBP-type [Brevibacterium mcbrellneri ATCC 49030]|uniref:Peptidyl-prolyl cis-trans isomerase n=1 Tax=Brevibacterium mcbrellneri ATCC 49030 TaxID=585530 RepID=D4YNT5_9MICO|nr:FKBP-type peptidyl-prolyl cis-trans isomerase [Brevibacterium mcbrellneri]EFG47075.1 peptidyl-prolyl cis-trans isomerase, FKBP-type [Brevibacterium mcbrellneri ATCC 49030]
MKKLVCAVAVSALVLTGCGGKEDEPTSTDQQEQKQNGSIDDIKVSGETNKKPEVEVKTPFAAENAHKTLEQGSGKKADKGLQVTAHYTVVSGESGKVVESSYDSKPSGFPVDDQQISKRLFDAIVGVQEGGRVLMVENASPGGNQPNQTLIYVWDIVKVDKTPEILSKAEGTEKEIPGDLPQVTRDKDGKPSISQPKGDAPKELTVKPAIEGDGPVVKEGQKVSVHYTGWLWDDTSKPFDSSWDRGQPFSFTPGAGEVIAGWEEGVTGQKVGSQILLVVPADKGYGDAGSPPNIPGGATLVFVVDILAAVG